VPRGFEALAHVATNRPSHLIRPAPGLPGMLPFLARFPEECIIEEFGPRQPPQELWFAAGGEFGERGRKGRLLVLADHSVFINDMLGRADNDNFTFALLCLEWLTDGGRRDRVLFVE